MDQTDQAVTGGGGRGKADQENCSCSPFGPQGICREFREKINDDDDEGAVEFARAQTDEVTIRLFLLPSLTRYFQFIRVQILQIAVNGRKNSLILRVLGELCSGDQMRAKCLLEKAVLLVTLNDDHETLEEILNWAVDEGFSPSWKAEEFVDQHCPVLLACHENYTKCITVLYND